MNIICRLISSFAH